MEHAITELEQLLRDERDAIRKLDGAAVLAFARRKGQLIAAVGAADGTLDAASAARLRDLVPALRHNGILLAHARDIMRDALSAVGAAPRASRGGSPARRFLSVRG